MIEKLSYTVNEATEALGIGRTTIYELIKAGELAVVKIGSRTIIRRKDLDALLDRLTRRQAA
jgi:excisionase family DNA binding protein